MLLERLNAPKPLGARSALQVLREIVRHGERCKGRDCRGTANLWEAQGSAMCLVCKRDGLAHFHGLDGIVGLFDGVDLDELGRMGQK